MPQKFLRYGLILEYITLLWNIIGCLIVLFAAMMAHSVALAGFGIDSCIEIFASLIVIWQLKSINKRQELLAEREIGVAFLLLSVYIFLQSFLVIITQFHPQTSVIGIIWLFMTALVMFGLAYGKSKIGHALNNPVLLKEGKVTLVDGFLAVSVLTGIVLNGLFGWWWADPLSCMILVYYGLKEGFQMIPAFKVPLVH